MSYAGVLQIQFTLDASTRFIGKFFRRILGRDARPLRGDELQLNAGGLRDGCPVDALARLYEIRQAAFVQPPQIRGRSCDGPLTRELLQAVERCANARNARRDLVAFGRLRLDGPGLVEP